MFKAPEILYFWRDPYYTNVIVAVTSNRSRLNATGPYSASIFRIRGDGYVQMFFQRAQEFFNQLSAVPTGLNNNNSKVLVEKSTTVDNFATADNEKNQKKKSRHHTVTSKPSPAKSGRSFQPTTPGHQSSRKEFDASRPRAKSRNSIFNLYNNRTNSETTLLNETRRRNSKGRHRKHEKESKVTSISVHLSGEHVAELMRELKELRNEIASLKLENRVSQDTRSMSTSPLAVQHEHSKKTIDTSTTTSSSSFPDVTSQSEVDAETQTDFSLINHRRRHLLKKNKKTMIGSGGISSLIKKLTPPSHIRNSRRTLSNSSTNTATDPEGK
jgi:hypothetical protein